MEKVLLLCCFCVVKTLKNYPLLFLTILHPVSSAPSPRCPRVSELWCPRPQAWCFQDSLGLGRSLLQPHPGIRAPTRVPSSTSLPPGLTHRHAHLSRSGFAPGTGSSEMTWWSIVGSGHRRRGDFVQCRRGPPSPGKGRLQVSRGLASCSGPVVSQRSSLMRTLGGVLAQACRL